jgi:hypothetical protein
MLALIQNDQRALTNSDKCLLPALGSSTSLRSSSILLSQQPELAHIRALLASS